MRELRFRIIDPNTKKLIGYETWDIAFGWAFVILPDNNVRIGTLPDGIDRNIRNQWTGLKDKNGKEIYEGDIIQNIADDGTKLSSFEIKWIEEQCRFVKWKLENVDEGARYYDLSQSRFFTVIGNIYETPTP